MSSHRLLRVALKAGTIILESGAEIYRVEETIIRICKAYGAKEVEPFVMPTGIVISLTDSKGNTHSIVKRITERNNNLEKIHLVNNLSRKIVESNYSIDEVEKELTNISELKSYDIKLQVLFSAIAVSFYSLLYNGSVRDFFSSFIIGITIKIVVNKLYQFKLNAFFVNIIGGAIATIGGLFFSQLKICENLNIVITSSIMLLVPGMIITNAIRDVIAGDLVSGVSRVMEAFFIAVAIAIGTGLIFKLWFLYGGFI